MARGTKSSKGSGKKAESKSEEIEPQGGADQSDTPDSESQEATSDGGPVVIEGEAVDVSNEENIDEASSDGSDAVTDNRIAGAAAETRNATAIEPGHETAASETVQSEPKPEPVAPAVAPPPPPAQGGGSFLGTILGGMIAAAIGFGLATYGAPRGWLSFAGVDAAQDGAAASASFASIDDVTSQSGRIDGLEQAVGTLTESVDSLATGASEPGEAPVVDLSPLETRIDSLASEIETLREMPPQVLETEAGQIDLSPIQTAIAELGTRLTGVDENLSGLEESLTGMEERLATLEEAANSTEGSDAMAEQLAAFRTEMDEVAADARSKIDEAEARAAEIEAAAAAAEARAAQAVALAEVKVALDNGAGFAGALQMLDAVPEALASKAEDGVATLAELQRAFPPAARAALAVSQSVPEDAPGGSRLVAFLKKQTNARSLAPKEGDDADAVLSRAEAALGSGDLAATMTELSALSEEAQGAMSDWLALAEERIAAVDAVSVLSDELN